MTNQIRPMKNPVFRGQLLAHLSIIPMIMFAHAWQYGVALGVYFLAGCLGMSVTYHRFLSHKSWKCPRWFEILGTLMGSIVLTGSSIAWVAVHRDHHMHTDKPADPHSPLHQSVWRVQFLSMLYRPKLRYARNLIQDPFHRWVHRHYLHINIAYAAILLMISPFAVVYAYLFPAAIFWAAGNSINTLSHTFGYQTYATKDSSRNNFLVGYLVWGEGWHNNHHRYPRSPFFGRRWFELDIGGLFIRMFHLAQGLGISGTSERQLPS